MTWYSQPSVEVKEWKELVENLGSPPDFDALAELHSPSEKVSKSIRRHIGQSVGRLGAEKTT
jgi:hypothetical protein